MTKLLILTAVLIALTGCTKSPHEIQHHSLPAAGLADCTYHWVDITTRELHVIRCPNSSTTTTSSEGKSGDHTTTVVDEAALRAQALSKLNAAERQALGL